MVPGLLLAAGLLLVILQVIVQADLIPEHGTIMSVQEACIFVAIAPIQDARKPPVAIQAQT